MPQDIKRLLIVQPQGIGDVIMTTPAVAGLRAIEPKLRIGIVVRTSIASDVARDSKLYDAVFTLDRKQARIRDAINVVWSIRSEFKPDVCVIAPYVSPTYGEPFAFAVGARIRIGSHSLWPLGGFSHVLPETLHMHKIRATLACVRCVFPDCPEGKLTYVIDEHARAAAAEIYGRMGLASGVVLGIHPGTDDSGTMRRYSPAYYKRIVSLFLKEFPGSRVLVFLGPSEEYLEYDFAAVHGVDVLRGLPLGIVAALIRRTTVFLGSDSALVHIAAATGVPVLTIFGPADPSRTRPWSENASVVRHEPVLSCMPCIDNSLYNTCATRPCLSSLPPSRVFHALKEIVSVISPPCRVA